MEACFVYSELEYKNSSRFIFYKYIVKIVARSEFYTENRALIKL